MKDVKNSLTFDVTKTPGKKMMENLMAAMQTKLHQLFLDPTVNSIRTVEINLQDSFVYFARRFDAFVSELPPRKQIRILYISKPLFQAALEGRGYKSSFTMYTRWPGKESEQIENSINDSGCISLI